MHFAEQEPALQSSICGSIEERIQAVRRKLDTLSGQPGTGRARSGSISEMLGARVQGAAEVRRLPVETGAP